MTKKIKCETKNLVNTKKVRVRIIKAPLIDTAELRSVLYARARALVL